MKRLMTEDGISFLCVLGVLLCYFTAGYIQSI